MGKILGIIGVLAVLAIVIYVVSVTIPESGNVSEKNGRVVFAVTDDTAELETISAVNLTVDRVQIHSSAKGWVIITEKDVVCDLLELKATGAAKLLADVQLEEGSYDQIRLDVKNVAVVDAKGQSEAKLPSDVLTINANAEVTADKTSSVVIDFKAAESLHVTGKGEYVMFPVLKVETRNEVAASINAAENVVISGGKVTEQTNAGMDINGDIKINLKIPANAVIKIEGNLIKIEGESAMEPIGQTCLTECNGECETNIFVQCKSQCDIDANLACSSATQADCRAKCGSSITQAACQAACALSAKANCAANFKTDCYNSCETGVYANCKANCQGECQ